MVMSRSNVLSTAGVPITIASITGTSDEHPATMMFDKDYDTYSMGASTPSDESLTIWIELAYFADVSKIIIVNRKDHTSLLLGFDVNVNHEDESFNC